jgi:hypothetical protein
MAEHNKKLVKSRRLSIIGSILCLVGGILFIGSIMELLNSPYYSDVNIYLAAAPLGIFTIIGAVLGLKYQVGGRLICLTVGIMMGLTSIGGLSIMIVFGTIITIIGSIVGLIGGYIKIPIPRKIPIPSKSKKKLIENSKNVVDYLKTEKSGITQLELASILQIDHTKIEKSLNYLEKLGVIQKKIISAEETLFFYREDLDN